MINLFLMVLFCRSNEGFQGKVSVSFPKCNKIKVNNDINSKVK